MSARMGQASPPCLTAVGDVSAAAGQHHRRWSGVWKRFPRRPCAAISPRYPRRPSCSPALWRKTCGWLPLRRPNSSCMRCWIWCGWETLSGSFPRGCKPMWVRRGSCFPADSGSVWDWPKDCCGEPKCCCWMRSPPMWMKKSNRNCGVAIGEVRRHRHLTVVAISHRAAFLQDADRVVTLQDGVIVP